VFSLRVVAATDSYGRAPVFIPFLTDLKMHLVISWPTFFTYRFRYASLNLYGKRNSHSKDRKVATESGHLDEGLGFNFLISSQILHIKI